MMTTTTTPASPLPPATSANVSQAQFQLIPFLKATWQELPKLTRPTLMQVIANVLIVVLVSTVTTLFLWGIDKLFRFGIQAITPHHG
jgi:preprotein translocase SecE subunit